MAYAVNWFSYGESSVPQTIENIMQSNQSKKIRKIAVVGAGPSGLCCAKNAVDYGFEITVFERNAEVGGTWIYTDRTGNDDYGMPIHSSMYKGLRYRQRNFINSHQNLLSPYSSYLSLSLSRPFRCLERTFPWN